MRLFHQQRPNPTSLGAALRRVWPVFAVIIALGIASAVAPDAALAATKSAAAKVAARKAAPIRSPAPVAKGKRGKSHAAHGKGGRKSAVRKPPVLIAPHPVLVISVDGLAWPILQAQLDQLPNLRAILRRGVSGPMRTVLPSMTWPAHASMLTGQPPMVHGVVGNRWLERASGEIVQAWQRPMAKTIKGLTLPQLAKQAGIDTAAISWPGTSNAAEIRWNLPEVPTGDGMRAGSTPGLLADLDAAGVKSDDLDAWAKQEGEQLDAFSLAAAQALWQKHEPRLMLLHFLAFDAAAHRYGPASRQALAALRGCDKRIGAMIATLGTRSAGTDVIIVSDHGFFEVNDGLSPHRALARAKLDAAELAALTPVSNGQSLWLYAKNDAVGAAALKKALRALARDSRIAKALLPKAMLAQGLGSPDVQPRAPDAALLLRDNVMLNEPRVASRERRPGWHGMHGGSPGAAAMQAVWVAAGPCFARKSQIRGLRVVDVAPIVAASLGVAWPATWAIGKARASEGRLRRDMSRCGP